MKYLNRALFVAVLLATVVFSPSHLPGCGPFLPESIFTDIRVPPLPDFFRGRLGVLHPSFGNKYLVVAYRYLSGQPLIGKEVEALTSPPNTAPEPELVWNGSFYATPAVMQWLDARSRIPGNGPPTEIRVYRNDAGGSTNEWRYFLNCSEDAFRTAATTLDERAKAFGYGHPGIKSWAAAQDTVFSNCSKGENIPAAAEPDLPEVLKYDRAYQIGAAHFYSEHYDEAARIFRTIAADGGSPWNEIAPYLVARSLLRKASVPQRSYDRNALMEAEQVLRSILQDKIRASLHPIARKLEAFVRLRLYPLDQMRTLAQRLEKPIPGENFEQDLIDYQYLMAHLALFPGFTPESLRQTGDMADWIWTVHSGDAAHSLERWKSTGSTAWLAAAMIGLHAGQSDAAAAMDAARKIAPDSPAFATAQYHRIRVMVESGGKQEARSELDRLLPKLRSSLNNSSLNLFLSRRMQLARNLDEFLEFAPRVPQEILFQGSSSLPLFDEDSIKVLNRALPLSLLSRAGNSTHLPPHLTRELARAAWVRAVLIGDISAARSIAGELQHFYPDLESDLKTWLEAKDSESRQFASAMLMLHFPGTTPYLHGGLLGREKLEGIDQFRNNWWCELNSDGNPDASTGTRYVLSRIPNAGKPVQPAEFPDFLKDADKARFMQEWKRLSTVAAAPTYLGRIVVSWAEKHSGDNRVPEALHLVVKSSRFGCPDSETGRYSRAAFRLLHTRYPDTKWARATPYWYR